MLVLTNEDVAAKVRGVAAEKRITSAALAAHLSMSSMAMSRRMSGSTPFAPEELIQISRVLSVPVATFFGESIAAERVA